MRAICETGGSVDKSTVVSSAGGQRRGYAPKKMPTGESGCSNQNPSQVLQNSQKSEFNIQLEMCQTASDSTKYVMTEESSQSRPSLGVFSKHAPKKVSEDYLTALYKKNEAQDPTMMTCQSSLISEGNCSIVEGGDKIKLPSSRITKASHKLNKAPSNKQKDAKAHEYRVYFEDERLDCEKSSSPGLCGKQLAKEVQIISSNDSTPKASVVCSLPISALSNYDDQNFKIQIENVKKGNFQAFAQGAGV